MRPKGGRLRRGSAGRRRTDDRTGRTTGGARPANRMGHADLGNERRAENGAAQPGEPGRRDQAARRATRSHRMGHVLRHPSLRRAADIASQRPLRRLARALGRRRADGQLSRARRIARSHAYFRDSLAMAQRARIFVVPRDLAALHSFVGRDRRPGHSGQPAVALSASRGRACLRLDGSRRRIRGR